MSEQDLVSAKDALLAMPSNEVKNPDMPVAEFIQEGEDLFAWATHDREALQQAGLDLSLIDALPTRVGALRYQQALWQADTVTRQNALQEWKDQSPQGYDMVALLLHTFRFAFREHPELLQRVDEIAQDSGHADMVQDLESLSVLGSQNIALLEPLGFDATLLETASSLSDTLGALLGINNGDQQQTSEIKELRDRAYTYLKLAVDEIRKYGKFVFWRNPERIDGYASNYFRKQGSKSATKTKTIVTEA